MNKNSLLNNPLFAVIFWGLDIIFMFIGQYWLSFVMFGFFVAILIFEYGDK